MEKLEIFSEMRLSEVTYSRCFLWLFYRSALSELLDRRSMGRSLRELGAVTPKSQFLIFDALSSMPIFIPFLAVKLKGRTDFSVN